MQYYQIIQSETGPVIHSPLKGKPILTIPQLNKGTAFTIEERKQLGLLGKLPPCVETLEAQKKRAYVQYCDYSQPMHKNIFLNVLHNTNEILFYGLVKQHFKEMMPIVYTPVVGDSVIDFNKAFRQTRGLYVCYEDRDCLDEIFRNATNTDVKLIVVTDGSGVLGIGDQGVGGMGIPIAKLVLYTAIGGVSPYNTLPVMIDVGTDNPDLLKDPLYLGWRHPRIDDVKYREFIEKIIDCVMRIYPDVFVHWEDFSSRHASTILKHYQNKICTFNDDIQGTGVVTLAAIWSALKKKSQTLGEQRFLIFGAGAAGCGIADHLYFSMLQLGYNPKEVRECFWLIDRQGLLFEDDPILHEAQRRFARPSYERPGYDRYDLETVIRKVKPTVLIGSSAVKGAFTEEILKELAGLVDRPLILPLSNPISRAEATPQLIMEATDGSAFVATGSPFPSFNFGDELVITGQCNNAYAFPGIGLGVVAVNARRISDQMLLAASRAISQCVEENIYSKWLITPIPEMAVLVAKRVAYAVAEVAIEQGLAQATNESVVDRVDRVYWEPKYYPIIYQP